MKSGSKNPGKEVAGTITMKQIENIAKKKMADMNTKDIKMAMEMVKGSALSMGLKVVEE